MNGKKARALRKADTREFIGYREVNVRHKTFTVPNTWPVETIPYRTSTLEKAYAKQ